MAKKFFNVSNHSSVKWSEKQISATNGAEIIDIPFPNVNPNATAEDIQSIAGEIVGKIIKEASSNDCIVHVMGEMTLVYAIVVSLQGGDYTCVASTTERKVVENEDGTKTSIFEFVQFREY